MNLKEALEVAKTRARAETSTRTWGEKKLKIIKCRVTICKLNSCPFLDMRVVKGINRSYCGKTGRHISNMFAYKMECQHKWEKPE